MELGTREAFTTESQRRRENQNRWEKARRRACPFISRLKLEMQAAANTNLRAPSDSRCFCFCVRGGAASVVVAQMWASPLGAIV
jgi:hypothetical protein